MARILLIMPRMPQRMGAPYLGTQYVAAALLAAGHDVAALDLSAPCFAREGASEDEAEDVAIAAAAAYGPDAIGMTLFTWGAYRGYRLARRLEGVARLRVAGGPHPTVLPREPLENGFEVSVAGEGEVAMVAIAVALDGGPSFEGRPGIHTNAVVPKPWAPLADLDALAYPHRAAGAFDMRVYGLGDSGLGDRAVVPGGVMSSRGCPARCTFCANYVTGREYRWRTTPGLVTELLELRRDYGVSHFSFWDDAFTARRPRLMAVCDAFLEQEGLSGATWSCITPGTMVRDFDLVRMRKAGCLAVNFGLESGDPAVLRAIAKGQRPEQVRAAVQAAKRAGMTTIVNFMFGFPGEDEAALDRTLAVMEELSDDVSFFNNRGVLVPFPGTRIYDQTARRFGFEGWWLDEAMVPLEPELRGLSAEEAMASLAVDPTLALDFFGYSDGVRARIEAGVRFKAAHNLATARRLQAGSGGLGAEG